MPRQPLTPAAAAQRRRGPAGEACRRTPRPRPAPRRGRRPADTTSTGQDVHPTSTFRPPRKSPSPTRGSRRVPAQSRAPSRLVWSPRRRRAGSRGRARPPRPCAPRCGRGATATACRSSAARRASRPLGALLDQAQAEVDVAEQAALLGRPERRPALELARAADVVEERGGEQQVGAQPRVELAGLAAERRDADRVLEQAARVGVVAVRRRRERAQCRPDLASPRNRADQRRAARDARSRRRGTRGSRRARPRRGASRGVERRRIGVRPPRPSAPRAGAGRRKRSTRPSTRTASPSAKRPSSSSTSFQIARLDPPASGRRARARGTARRSASSAAACARRRRRPRRCGRPSARRCVLMGRV